MRNTFSKQMIKYATSQSCVFLTGDLGFNVLENVRTAFGNRFINCGIAEQNMIGVAAGLAKGGMQVFCYSIAPFIYARPFEFIRNDVVPQRLRVCLVGNGGGYHYGINGPTHHALEDCASMRAIGVRVLVPCFANDIALMLNNLSTPTYIRLGRDCLPQNIAYPMYSPWRKLLEGKKGVWITLGPLAGIAMEILHDASIDHRPELWACAEFDYPPEEVLLQIKGQHLTVLEEHVATGGLASLVCLRATMTGFQPTKLTHRFALGYPSNTFGNQDYHRGECGLDIYGVRRLYEEQRDLR